MSSIDKYVEGEARACNPRVRVMKESGRIRGYIGNSMVFDIADRSGYLNEQEKTIIKNSIRVYEEEQREKARREQIRLENERTTARAELKRDIVLVRNALDESYHNALRLHTAALGDMQLASKFSKLRGYNLSGYEAHVDAIEQKINACEDGIKQDYRSKLSEIDHFEKKIRENGTTQEYKDQRAGLRQVCTTVITSTLPVDEIHQLETELDKVAQVFERIGEIESELKKVPANGLAGSIAQNTIREIHGQSIGSLEDVDRLLRRIQEKLTEINSVEFENRAQDRADQIAHLNGIFKAYSQPRSYVVEQGYEAASYRTEIEKTANDVLSVYSGLRMADYTTCSKERMTQICDTAQEVLMGTRSDEQILGTLRKFFDEGEIYKRDDARQADHYADYRRKVEELTNRGYPQEELEAFDPFDYEKQSRRLKKLLLQQDIVEAVSRTKTTFLMACKTMEEMGYHMLHYDMGSEEAVDDALACEAIYVIPGCEGVVWKLIASDCNISRKVIGIKRTSGATTTVNRVREVAAQIETTGEINEYFHRYAESGGGAVTVTSAADTDTEGCEAVIMDNGCFELSAEGEEYYNKLVSSASPQQKAKWSTKIPKNTHSAVALAKTAPNERKEESARCRVSIEIAREMKK